MNCNVNNIPVSAKTKEKDTGVLRVCYLTESFYPIIGGGETQARLAAEWFSRHSVDLTVITRRVLVSSKRKEALFGARVVRIPPTGEAGFLRWPMMITALFWLMKERKTFDFIFVDGFRVLGVPAVLAGGVFGKKIVFKPQNIGEMSGAFFDGRLRKVGLSHTHWLVKPIVALRNFILRRVHAFCPTSTDMAKEFLRADVESDKVHLIPNCYDNSRFMPASADERNRLRKKHSIDKDRMVEIFTGRLVSWKGPQHLVKMWNEIVEANNHPLLLVVGPDGNDMFDCADEIRNYIRKYNLNNDVVMTGGVRNVEDYLHLSDFYVFPSQGGEGLPTSIIEAMACGLPVISTRSTGITDLVTPQTGLTVEPTDFEGFKAAIVIMLTQEELRKKLGRAAAKKAKLLYSPDGVICQYIQVFQALANQSVTSH